MYPTPHTARIAIRGGIGRLRLGLGQQLFAHLDGAADPQQRVAQLGLPLL